MRRPKPNLNRPTRHCENEDARPDKHVNQTNVQQSHGYAREEDFSDEFGTKLFEFLRQRHGEEDETEEWDREKDPYHVAPGHH